MRYVIDVVDWRVIQTVFGKEQVSQTFVLRKVGKPDNFAWEVWVKHAISWKKGRLNIPIYFGKIIHTKQLSYRDIYMLGYVYTQSQSLPKMLTTRPSIPSHMRSSIFFRCLCAFKNCTWLSYLIGGLIYITDSKIHD